MADARPRRRQLQSQHHRLGPRAGVRPRLADRRAGSPAAGAAGRDRRAAGLGGDDRDPQPGRHPETHAAAGPPARHRRRRASLRLGQPPGRHPRLHARRRPHLALGPPGTGAEASDGVLRVAPDGGVYAAGDSGLVALDAAGGSRWWTPLGMDDAVQALAVAPDGTVYFGSRSGAEAYLVARGADGRELWRRPPRRGLRLRGGRRRRRWRGRRPRTRRCGPCAPTAGCAGRCRWGAT